MGYDLADAVPREELAGKFAVETHYDGGYTPIAGERGLTVNSARATSSLLVGLPASQS